MRFALCAMLQGKANFFMDEIKSQFPKPDLELLFKQSQG